MAHFTVDLAVEALSRADTDRLADNFAQTLQGRVRSSRIQRITSSGNSQDAGSIVQVVLNAGAVAILARGIADWLRINQSAEIRVELKNGTKVSVKKINATTSLKIIEEVLASAGPDNGSDE